MGKAEVEVEELGEEVREGNTRGVAAGSAILDDARTASWVGMRAVRAAKGKKKRQAGGVPPLLLLADSPRLRQVATQPPDTAARRRDINVEEGRRRVARRKRSY